jgi:integral membrane protein
MSGEKKLKLINLYRHTALVEAISYLILLFIAMPLKYIWDIPEGVKYFGWIHGVLFLFYFVILIATTFKYRWSILRIIYYLIASVVPFLPFFIDKKLKQESLTA